MEQSPIRVCFPFVGDTVGGSHISTLLLIRNLDRGRFAPLIVLHEEGPLSKLLREQSIDYELLPIPHYPTAKRGHRWRDVRNLIVTIPRCCGFLRSRQISIVHTNDVRMHLTWAVPVRLAGARFIWHQKTNFTRSRLFHWMERLAHRIVAISNFTASTLQDPVALTKLQIIVPPFEIDSDVPDRSAAKAALLAELDQPRGTLVVGFFGNLLERKRPVVFSRAAGYILAAHGPGIVFPVFGAERGDQVEFLKAQVTEFGLNDHVRLMGFRYPVEPWMAACDLILAPAIEESFGRTLIDAMLVGTPVIASDSGGHREIIQSAESGILVPPDDPKAFADAALRLLRAPDTARVMAEKARSFVHATYSAHQHAQAIARLYDEVMSVGERVKPAPAAVPD